MRESAGHLPTSKLAPQEPHETGCTLAVARVTAYRILCGWVLKAALLGAVVLIALHAAAQVEYVDPTIGNVGILLVPTRPTVYLPNSMVRMYPMRADAMDDRIASFPLTINSHRMDELFSIMPGDRSPAAYDQEKTTPYYYSTRFDESLIQTEFTPTERCGYFRFTFPRWHGALLPWPTAWPAIWQRKATTPSAAKNASAT